MDDELYIKKLMQENEELEKKIKELEEENAKITASLNEKKAANKAASEGASGPTSP